LTNQWRQHYNLPPSPEFITLGGGTLSVPKTTLSVVASEEGIWYHREMLKNTKKILEYRILITPDLRTGTNKKCFAAYVPVLGIATDGDTVEEARANAEELTSFHLDSLKKEGKPLPRETNVDFISTAKVSI